MREKVFEALVEMGASVQSKGCKYIIDAVTLLDEEKFKRGKIGDIYRKVGEINNADWRTVERCMRNTFHRIITKGNLEAVEKYLTLQNITNGNLLFVMHHRLSKS